jgi:hypothetical protein
VRVERRRRAERFYACGALAAHRAARSTRALGGDEDVRSTCRSCSRRTAAVTARSPTIAATEGIEVSMRPVRNYCGSLRSHDRGVAGRKDKVLLLRLPCRLAASPASRHHAAASSSFWLPFGPSRGRASPTRLARSRAVLVMASPPNYALERAVKACGWRAAGASEQFAPAAR